MDTLLIYTVVVLGVLVAILAIPFDLAFDINRVSNKHNQFSGQVNIRWLFGLLRYSVNISDTTEKRQSKHLSTARESKSTSRTKTSNSTRVLSLLKQAPFRRRLYKFIQDLLQASHYRDLFLRLRIGVGDPADTGQLWILLGPLAAMARNLRNATVRIEPEFIDPMFNVQSRGKFRFIPLEFIALVIAFALSPPSLRAWNSLRHSHAA